MRCVASSHLPTAPSLSSKTRMKTVPALPTSPQSCKTATDAEALSNQAAWDRRTPVSAVTTAGSPLRQLWSSKVTEVS